MRCGGLASQLRARAEGAQNAIFGQLGDMITITRKTLDEKECVGNPTASPQEKIVGSNDRTRPPVEKGNSGKLKAKPPQEEPKVEIDAAMMREVCRAKSLRCITRRPGYACGDDGLDAWMTEATLRYFIQEEDCVDEAYRVKKF